MDCTDFRYKNYESLSDKNGHPYQKI